jgi:uncharacterized protein (UPF0332 family)
LRDDVRELLEKADRSLGAAEELLNTDYPEFAVSRAYYAMLYCAQALLLSRDLIFSKHSAVISAFGKEFIKTKRLPEELHAHLISAFKERQKSDYEATGLPTEEEAEQFLDRARSFLYQVKKFLEDDH